MRIRPTEWLNESKRYRPAIRGSAISGFWSRLLPTVEDTKWQWNEKAEQGQHQSKERQTMQTAKLINTNKRKTNLSNCESVDNKIQALREERSRSTIGMQWCGQKITWNIAVFMYSYGMNCVTAQDFWPKYPGVTFYILQQLLASGQLNCLE
jgi:hypothetical protein